MASYLRERQLCISLGREQAKKVQANVQIGFTCYLKARDSSRFVYVCIRSSKEQDSFGLRFVRCCVGIALLAACRGLSSKAGRRWSTDCHTRLLGGSVLRRCKDPEELRCKVGANTSQSKSDWTSPIDWSVFKYSLLAES